MNTKRKVDLFRFTTLRAPQLISKDRRKLGFVENHGFHHSNLFEGVGEGDELSAVRDALLNAIPNFNPYESVEKIKELDTNFWDFSLWLAKNKNSLKRDELDAIVNAQTVDDAVVSDLWDNVYFDVVTEKNPYVRQACLQLLVADNFARNYQNYSPNADPEAAESEAELLKRLANGKVVLHPAVTQVKIKTLPELHQNHRTRRRLETKIKAQIAQVESNNLKAIEKELHDLKKQYSSDYDEALKAAQGAHSETTGPILAEYFENNPEIENDPEVENLIPKNLLPDFDFKFSSPLSREYTTEKLSKDAEQYISSHSLEKQSIDDVLSILKSSKSTEKKSAARVHQKKISELSIRGVKVKSDTKKQNDFGLAFKENITGGHDVYLSLETGYDGAYFRDASFDLTMGEEVRPLRNPCLLNSTRGNIFIKLNDEPISLDPCTIFELNASYTLNDGRRFSFSRSGTTNSFIFSGRAYLLYVDEGEAVTYGVNRIGVADYRKVEQELCCYIPGEVSHIENVMAKEYKERSTRSMLRTETGLEQRSERETEDTTDTTTTSRHEMSSEVANVIEKDRQSNFGVSTYVNGEGPKKIQWGLNANADFSFGQSTSNSNSISRTYAKDVTRRALERIVQKTSLLRTSKMIREFEETNKHGFDNRKGDTHVTGVYRWVDKVYKNRIRNYGKRLIYEFMVPEPSRWYKEAIIVEKEEDESDSNNSTDVLTKPAHPKDHGILNSESIQRDNYAQFSSLYGVSIQAPQDKDKLVSAGYTGATGNDDNNHNYDQYPEVLLPNGYTCHKIGINVSGRYKSKVSEYARIKVIAGPVVYPVNFGDNEENFYRPGPSSFYENGGLNISSTAKVSITTFKIVNFACAVKFHCQLDQSLYEQWQQDGYSQIMDAYNAQLTAYNEAQEAAKAEQEAQEALLADAAAEKGAANSKFNSQIINTELKRLCIEMLTKPFGRTMGKDFYLNGECKVPNLALSKNLDNYSAQVKFFEQALEWDILSELFYPYYWAKKCDWKDLYQAEAINDHIFKAFLQSGMARVMVPVREGFEDAVTFYMETGKIWNGTGLVVDTDDELYLSIVDEMTELEGHNEEEEWETIVPSDLTIIQAKSAYLDDEGLPCCEDDADTLSDIKFVTSENTLSLLSEEGEEEPPV